jgi:hypothetical protein
MMDQAGGSLRDLYVKLQSTGRVADALLLIEHMLEAEPGNIDILQDLIALLTTQGRLLDALGAFQRGQAANPEMQDLASHFTPLFNAAFEECQAHYRAGNALQAEAFLALLAEILPNHPPFASMALSCNRVLGRTASAAFYGERMLHWEPDHQEARLTLIDHCRATGDRAGEAAHRLALMRAGTLAEPVNQGWNIYETVNLLMCQPLDEEAILKVAQAQAILSALREKPEDSDRDNAAAWIRFYQSMVGGIDLDSLSRPMKMPPHPLPPLFEADGSPMSFADVQTRAAQYQIEAAFLVAADEVYVTRFAAHYLRSVLRHADIPCLVIIHVIGGAARMAPIIANLGVTDERVIFSCDDLDGASLVHQVLDSPSQPPITKPITHYQSARFHQAGLWLYGLKVPLFITDIDCLLERGVDDLLREHAGKDIVLNENHVIAQFAARITANLLLLLPTRAAQRFIRFVSAYLDRALQGPSSPKWIDQIALMMGQHHLRLTEPQAAIGYFDVDRDINNCIFPAYTEHPFRFLSLYQGFDLASLPTDH